MTAINEHGHDPESYVHAYYRREAYKAAYGYAISPMNGKRMWPFTPDGPILPPLYKRKPGRPKKLRRRGPHEDDEEGTRPNPRHRCGRCGVLGHNVRSCTNPPLAPQPPPETPEAPQPPPEAPQAPHPPSEVVQEPTVSYSDKI